MKRMLHIGLAIAVGLLVNNVDAQQTGSAKKKGGSGSAQKKAQTGSAAKAAGSGAKSMGSPVAVTAGKAVLKPENTKIEFVGTHVGEKPDPRLGGFKKFKGTLTLNPDGASIKSLNVDIDTTSIWTEIGNTLTNHLKSDDFLDVKKYPTAKFTSTEVKPGADGTVHVAGQFTMLGNTQPITIPLKLKKHAQGVTATGELKLDRTNFGMAKMTEKVNKLVAIKLTIGEATKGAMAQTLTSGKLNLSDLFENQDTNKDGKLMGDEIPQRLKTQLKKVDTNGDGAISMEEIKAIAGKR